VLSQGRFNLFQCFDAGPRKSTGWCWWGLGGFGSFGYNLLRVLSTRSRSMMNQKRLEVRICFSTSWSLTCFDSLSGLKHSVTFVGCEGSTVENDVTDQMKTSHLMFFQIDFARIQWSTKDLGLLGHETCWDCPIRKRLCDMKTSASLGNGLSNSSRAGRFSLLFPQRFGPRSLWPVCF